MKRWLIGLVMASWAGWAMAEREALIQPEDTWNMYSRFEVQATRLDGSTAYLGGLKVGGLLNDQFILGLGGQFLIDNAETRSPFLSSLENTDFWLAGVHTGYIFNPHRLVHLVADVLIGGGAVDAGRIGGGSTRSSLRFVEPAVSAKVNITETFSIGLGVGYRLVDGSDVQGLSDSNLSGVTGALYLHFTQF
ncbi:MAG TPA: hypothetical protein PKE55_09410 [Kiritimatiellia bacterium]|nr:hypothetical protein [Kiritimatiellia bacterium]